MTILRHIARTRKILRGWKDISSVHYPQMQQCPECGAVACDYWAASSHQTWHGRLAKLLRLALESSPAGRAYLAELAGAFEADTPSASAPHTSSYVTETIQGAVDTMSPGRHETEE